MARATSAASYGPRAATPNSGAPWLAAAGLLLAGSAVVPFKDQRTALANAEQEEGETPTPGKYCYTGILTTAVPSQQSPNDYCCLQQQSQQYHSYHHVYDIRIVTRYPTSVQQYPPGVVRRQRGGTNKMGRTLNINVSFIVRGGTYVQYCDV